MRKRCFLVVFVVVVTAGRAYATHPLITDDTGTQGRGNFQFEFTAEYEHEIRSGVTTNTLTVPTMPVLSYGLTDSADIVFGLSYIDIETKEAAVTKRVRGISDMSIEVKWRFYEKDGLSFAIKPGLTLPTGDAERGTGEGDVTGHLFFIATKEMKPWAFHFNLGYIRNENTVDEQKNLWHVSAAAERQILKDLKAVADIGIERARDGSSRKDPAFVLGGLVYSLSDHLDIDIGVKRGLNRPGTDYSVLSGITWKF